MSGKISTSSVSGLSTKAFDYDLPNNRIAKYPLVKRDASKLLIWQNGKITDAVFKSLHEFLPKKSLLVFNNTKVIRARLQFQKKTGADIEIFCLDPVEPADYQLSFQQTQSCSWNCMVGNLKKWKEGPLIKEIQFEGEPVLVKAEKRKQDAGKVQVRFSWDNPKMNFASLIEAFGVLPIPPYLDRETEESDKIRYQTIYSKIKGSVAAPTAGLHFTDDVFNALKKKEITCAELTLHVGAGTFKPVKSETIADHEMHAEQILVKKDFLKLLLKKTGKRIAVGTTSIRTLESLYWLGCQLLENPGISPNQLQVEQWLPYQKETNISVTDSLHTLISYLDKHRQECLIASTQMIIIPGYQFRIVDGMITNFHQPQSTLLLLISAYLGNEWKKIYEHALQNGYRFLSYGDSNLYLK